MCFNQVTPPVCCDFSCRGDVSLHAPVLFVCVTGILLCHVYIVHFSVFFLLYKENKKLNSCVMALLILPFI